MQINYLKHREIDFEKWDLAVDNAQNPIIYAKAWFLNIVSPNWDAVVSDDYKVIMPLCWREKYGIKYLYQPIFSQLHSIVFAKNLSADEEKQVLELIIKKYKFIDIGLNIYNFELINNFNFIKRTTYLLDLNKSYKELNSNYSKNHKKNIEKAGAKNIIIKNESNQDFFINGFKALIKKKNIANVNDIDINNLDKIISYSLKNNLGELYNAYYNNEFCASFFFLIYNNRAVYFSVTNSVGKNVGAMYLLTDNFIKKYAGNNMVLDFAGSDIKGVAYRNKGFGAEAKKYYRLKENNLPIFLRWLKK